MKPWHVGMKVVCINAAPIPAPGSIDPQLIQDKIYTIGGICSCQCCGHIVLDVGLHSEVAGFMCFCAYPNFRNEKVHWCSERRFIPLEDYTNMETELSEILQPVTPATESEYNEWREKK